MVRQLYSRADFMGDLGAARKIDPRPVRPKHSTISGMEIEECYRAGDATGVVG